MNDDADSWTLRSLELDLERLQLLFCGRRSRRQ